MTTFFTEVRQTLVPHGEIKHGPLPPLLVAMTLVTGLVDAFSGIAPFIPRSFKAGDERRVLCLGQGWMGHLTLYSYVLYNVWMEQELRSNHNVTFSCHYHVVWCPKYRRKVLVNGVDTRLKQIIEQVCQEHEALLEGMEVMPDHVHLLVSVDPHFGIHRLVRLLKGRSSRFLRQEFPRLRSRLPTLWTNSYFVSTTGGAQLELVKKYIEGQKRG